MLFIPAPLNHVSLTNTRPHCPSPNQDITAGLNVSLLGLHFRLDHDLLDRHDLKAYFLTSFKRCLTHPSQPVSSMSFTCHPSTGALRVQNQ